MSSDLLSNRYRVLNVLGEGGFGKTFLVEDMQMPSNRRCVLKQLKPVHNSTVELRQLVQSRFQREATTVERLGEEHEQIPRLYAYFSEAEQFYLVQEWIDGITIAQKVQREGIQSEQFVKEMVVDLLGALAFIHSKGIVHRDIKPDNIILRNRDNQPVLIDFGAVKETMNTVVDSQDYSARSIVVGTPGYMPIEQLSGRPVYASDIYSLGMTAIYMLTGKTPQEISSDPASGELLWRDYAPTVSSDFAAVLDKAVHSNAQSRYSTAQTMQAALQPLVSSASRTEISPSPNYAAAYTQPPQYNSGDASAAENTLVVAPGDTSKAPPAPATRQQGSSTKNAWIVGSLVSISLLAGAVIVGQFFSQPEELQVVEEPVETSEPAASVESSSVDAIAPTPPPALASAPPLPESPSATEPIVPEGRWKFIGKASSGESISVDTSSLQPSGDRVAFEYRIDGDRIAATADCLENRWYAEEYGWYTPQSEATQLMLNFVCQ